MEVDDVAGHQDEERGLWSLLRDRHGLPLVEARRGVPGAPESCLGHQGWLWCGDGGATSPSLRLPAVPRWGWLAGYVVDRLVGALEPLGPSHA